MGGKTTEAGGSANQGRSGLHVICYDARKTAEACLQTDLDHWAHREKQKMLKSPGGTRATGQDLALEHRVFRDLEEPEVVMGILLVLALGSSWSCSGQTPWR